MDNFKRLAADFSNRFEALVSLDELGPEAAELCSYALFPPGKCFRAALCLFSASQIGVNEDEVISFATGVEILHAATLVHDDLPALDNDSMRRGKASLHKQYGEAAAVLAGDALIGLAFSTISKQKSQSVHPGQLRLLALLARATQEVCQGQVLDLKASGIISPELAGTKRLSAEDELVARHSLKTASLIQAAAIAPCEFLDESESAEYREALCRFGLNLGLLFQITDDILEVTQDAHSLGKNTDSDERKGVPTFVSVHGLGRAQELARECAEKCRHSVRLNPRIKGFEEVIALVEHRRR